MYTYVHTHTHDRYFIGKFEYVFACGTSFSLSAVMRRSVLPSSLVAHVHGFISGEQDLTRHAFSAEKTFKAHENWPAGQWCTEVLGKGWL